VCVAEAREGSGYDRHPLRLRHITEQCVELAHIRQSVVGRQLHADDQHLRFCGLRGRDHRFEIGARGGEVSPAQRIVASEFQDHDRGLVLRQERWQSRASSRSGVAADGSIDDPIAIAIGLESRREQCDPSLAVGNAVTGRDRIADDQQHWGVTRGLHNR
jgi:hypothetical protein